ncbi:LysE/ArgO family amino acid transporter [Aurantimonas sp. VKM B-3413]|uniref:LysE/ArgO family amino acid transporter n=1 Tax=Aurantimonas sp. VKM B-3413 TaxID=2779401 RepID=UPI001E5F5B3D|nr:LysE/ArgO family amino acid transporter [Aurantimonas sp. VKM B-3413]MCB8838862.1 LysE/ArgO family amino acid transporter [Aurantimonas sp. VKM B-3413]
MTEAFATGLAVGLGLILAIGAQNAFVLRQGLRGEHLLLVCLTCALSDAILILAGVGGFSVVIDRFPMLDPALRYAGAAFLLWYGARSFIAALSSSEVLMPAESVPNSARRTLLMCLALTWLNPHVYLDTVVLIGTISTRFPGQAPAFALGAMTASFLFFFSLGYGSALLRPLFAKASSWRVLEFVVGVTMWSIAAKLVLGL